MCFCKPFLWERVLIISMSEHRINSDTLPLIADKRLKDIVLRARL